MQQVRKRTMQGEHRVATGNLWIDVPVAWMAVVTLVLLIFWLGKQPPRR
jgi:hypothetical protein